LAVKEILIPKFTWFRGVGPTAIKFLNSDKLGRYYQDDMFVGDIINGNIYYFKLNKEDALQETIFGKGFGGITDIKVGLKDDNGIDDYLYVLTFHKTGNNI
jgi:aldose sugar dehydrogenase